MAANIPIVAQTADTARRQALPFSLAPGEQATLFIRLFSTSSISIDPWLYDRDAYETTENQSALWDGVLLGGLLLLVWVSLLIALMSRNVNFGLLWLLCTVIFLYEASQRGYAQIYLWPQAGDWALRSTAFLGFTAMALTLTFILAIARMEAVRVRGKRLFVAVIALQTTIALTALFGDLYWVTKVGPYATTLYGVSALVCAIILVKASIPSSRLMVMAGTFIAAHTLLRVSDQTGVFSHLLIDLGLGAPATDPILALTRLGLNVAVLTAWVIIIAQQRNDAQNELIRLRETERDRLQKQVAIQTEALNRSLQYANEENRQKTETLSYVGHDLRAPLATIVGYTRLLAASATPNQQDHVKAIERSASYQLSLIDEIVDYARHEQPTLLEISPEPVALDDFLSTVIQHALALCQQQNNRLEIRATTPLPAAIQTDPKRLQQILLNLISNATKFTRNGYIQLTVCARHDTTQTTLEFQVKDSGPGIELAQQDMIFEAFSQIDARPGSLGLGLHIVRRIIHNLHGTITLDSLPGQGSRFSFTLPITPLTTEVIQFGDITLPPDVPSDGRALLKPYDVPPVELRVDLAKYAREGQLTSIEQWLEQQTKAHPNYAPFFNIVRHALTALDFDRIEALALTNTK